jgi:hypothetical protein
LHLLRTSGADPIVYVRHAVELRAMSEDEMAMKFNLELGQAVRREERKSDSMSALIEMHKRHAESVYSVLTQQLASHAGELVDSSLSESSLLSLVAGQVHQHSTWRRYADRIADMLTLGLPAACQTHRPRNEPHLQEICDGILRGQDSLLVREFPFLRWSSSATKPDWSAEGMRLWVELKYIRQPRDIRQITGAIAADITKYGDNQRNVLFVVYDPGHLVVDETAFSSDIARHQGMLVRFIR